MKIIAARISKLRGIEQEHAAEACVDRPHANTKTGRTERDRDGTKDKNRMDDRRRVSNEDK